MFSAEEKRLHTLANDRASRRRRSSPEVIELRNANNRRTYANRTNLEARRALALEAKPAKEEAQREHCADKSRNYRRLNPLRVMVTSARRRSKAKGLPFDLDWKDLAIPETCPVLGITIRQSAAPGMRIDNSPSLDRIDPTGGYVINNVRIISWRANRIKADATSKEIELLYLDSLTR